MAFYQNLPEAIQSVRTLLRDNRETNDPENYTKKLGMLDYLHGPQNLKTIDAIMRDNSNVDKYRPVDIRFQKHWDNSDVITDDSLLTCDPVAQRRDDIQQYQPQLFTSSKATIDEQYVRENQEDGTSPETRLQEAFMKAMRVGREDMDSQIVSKAATLIGSNPAAGTAAGAYTTLELLNSDGSLSVDTFDTLKNQQEDNFQLGEPAAIGLGNMRKVFNRFSVGNVNTDAGLDWRDVASQFGMMFYRDQFAPTNLAGANRVLFCYPGLQQFYHYNLNRGFFDQQTPDLRIKGTMQDTVYPFEWDYILAYDSGCATGNGIQGSWTLTLFCYYDLWTPPTNAWGGAGTELEDFTGIVGYDITQAV